MKNISTILLCGLIWMLSACEKDTEAFNFAPKVTTGTASDIYRKGATLSGSIHIPEGTILKKYGILLSKQQSMAEPTEYVVSDKSTEFSFSIEGLDYATTYYYSTFASAGYSMVKSETNSFTTLKDGAPLFHKPSMTESTGMSATLSVNLLDDGGSEMTVSGFCWTDDVNKTPTIQDNVQNFTFQNETMSGTITGLEPNKSYRVCAYASNATGTGYSESIIVTTKNMYTPTLDKITQVASENLSVTLSSKVLDAGNGNVNCIGFCWSTENKEPDTDQMIIDLSEQLEANKFTTTIDKLSFSTTYYIRAFAINEMGTGYSETFTYQSVDPKVPELKEIELTDSTDTSITVSSQLLESGTSQVKNIGFCWSKENPEPSINDTHIDLTEQMEGADFSTVITDLKPGSTYYVRAYATNEEGVGYSQTFTHQTRQLPVPVLSEVEINNYTGTSISVSAQILEDHSTTIEKQGFCWSTESQEPTIQHNALDLNDQIGSSTFSATINELNPNTTYYIRAYAINSEGVGYSQTVTCKTLESALIQGTEGEAYVAEAGGLHQFIDETNKYNITKLKVGGYLNGDDILLLRKMAGRDYNDNETEGKLVDLDMTDAVIVEGGSRYRDGYFTKYNIFDNFFSLSKIERISLPITIKEIKSDAFIDCSSLISVHIQGNITNLTGLIFKNCPALTEVILPDGITTIDGAFIDCTSLTEINLPKGLKTIGESTFYGCSSLISLHIPDGVTTIGENAFRGCSSLTEINIPNGITKIESGTFGNCSSLTEIILPEHVTSIGASAFSSCSSLTKITLPKGITTLGNGVFYHCSALTEVQLPDQLMSIGRETFYACKSLKSINLPKGVTSIGESAFAFCEKLTECKSQATTPPIIDTGIEIGTFEYIASNCILYVPKGHETTYSQSDWGTYFANIKEMNE